MKSKKIFLFLLFFLFILSTLIYIVSQRGIKSDILNKENKEETCIRVKSFNLDSEFKYALDLISERSKTVEDSYGSIKDKPRFYPSLDFRNCFDIFYSDNIPNIKSTGAWFDSENSTPNHLIIKINPEYKNQSIDNLVMAMLLAHELNHVDLFMGLRPGSKLTCVQQETNAFLSQLRFLAILNKEEQPKLMNLIKTKYYYVLGTFYDLWIDQDKASTPCNESQLGKQFNQEEFNNCFWDKMQSIAENYITTIPGYQEHCKLK